MFIVYLLPKNLSFQFLSEGSPSSIHEDVVCLFVQAFPNLVEKPLLVDLTIEEGQRLKVIYGSIRGFHAINLDTSEVMDIHLPSQVRILITLYAENVG